MQELQPLIKELQRKHGKDAQKLQEETLKLYREHKVNPVGGCLPLLLQLPIFFGVYQAIYHLFGGEMGRQYLSERAAIRLEDPVIHELFERKLFGLIDAGQATFGSDGFGGFILVILPLLSIVFQFLQTLMATPRVQDPQQKMMTQMMMFMPLIFGYIAFTFPQGAVLYWVISSVIGIVQQYFTSGWGSLANYLKFLPPDGKTSATPALAPAVVAADAGGAGVVATPIRADFWNVMSPLTGSKDLAIAEADSAEVARTDPVEQHSHRTRPPNRQPVNARRSRKRK